MFPLIMKYFSDKEIGQKEEVKIRRLIIKVNFWHFLEAKRVSGRHQKVT